MLLFNRVLISHYTLETVDVLQIGPNRVQGISRANRNIMFIAERLPTQRAKLQIDDDWTIKLTFERLSVWIGSPGAAIRNGDYRDLKAEFIIDQISTLRDVFY